MQHLTSCARCLSCLYSLQSALQLKRPVCRLTCLKGHKYGCQICRCKQLEYKALFSAHTGQLHATHAPQIGHSCDVCASSGQTGL